MLILGHTGITLGAAVLLNGLLKKVNTHRTGENNGQSPREQVPSRTDARSGLISWFDSLGRRVDIRLLLLGALLPDIIDKPVGQLFFRETFSNGRIFLHTLLFLVVISLIGIYLYRKNARTWLLVMSSGVFTHLIFDQIWRRPRTMLWPLYGLAFEKVNLTGWTGRIFHALLTNPAVYIPELIGGITLVMFAWTLLSRRKVRSFIRHGTSGDY